MKNKDIIVFFFFFKVEVINMFGRNLLLCLLNIYNLIEKVCIGRV